MNSLAAVSWGMLLAACVMAIVTKLHIVPWYTYSSLQTAMIVAWSCILSGTLVWIRWDVLLWPLFTDVWDWIWAFILEPIIWFCNTVNAL